MEPGVYYQLCFEDYISNRDWIGATQIKEGAKSMLRMKLATASSIADTADMHIGRLAHGLLFDICGLDDLVVYVGKVRRGKAWEQVLEDCGGSSEMIVTENEYNRLVMMQSAIKDHSAAHEVLQSIDQARHKEMSIFLKHPTYGQLKGRIDGYSEAHGIVEYKTTPTLDPEKFFNNAFNLGYHYQAGFYYWLVRSMLPEYKCEKVTFIVQETKPPYDCMVAILEYPLIWELSKASLAIVHQFRECEQRDYYPGAAPEVIDYRFPRWSTFSTDSEGGTWTL